MKKKKLAIASGIVVVVFFASVFLQSEVGCNLYKAKEINDMYGKKSCVYTDDQLAKNQLIGLIIKNQNLNYLKKQSQQVKEVYDLQPIQNGDEVTAYNEITDNNESDDRVYLPEPTVSINKNVISTKRVELPVPYICQYPELPTGCEITSLTTVLNYLGNNVSKETMADTFLPKCDIASGSFWDYFWGDPRDEYSFGCYALPIITAANSYLKQQGSTLSAYNYSGSDFEVFLEEIQGGNPVILWSTINLEKPFISYSCTINEQNVDWIAPEHCVVMIGYDLDANKVTISDPMQGIVSLDMDEVNLRYRQMCSQAVIIK